MRRRRGAGTISSVDAPYRSSAPVEAAGTARCLYCGKERRSPRCDGCGAEVPTVPCLVCGAPVAAPAQACACGAPCTAWDAPAVDGVACPRCGGALERVRLDESMVFVEQCTRCLGCFVGAPEFAELVAREEEGREVGLRRFVPLPPGKELPRQVLLSMVRCARCRREMDRVRFAQKAAIVIDVCPTHGVWLDAGELVLVMNYVRSRSEGDVAPTSEEFSEAEWLRRSEVEQARIALLHGQRAPRDGPGGVEPIRGERSYQPPGRAANFFLECVFEGVLAVLSMLAGD